MSSLRSKKVRVTTSWGELHPHAVNNPNTWQALSNQDPSYYGYISCTDPETAATTPSFPSADGVPGHYRRLHIPKVPINATVLSSTVLWQISAHVICRTENVSAYEGIFQVDPGEVFAVLTLGLGATAGTGIFASDYHIYSRGLPALPPVTLAPFDSVLNWSGDSGITQSARVAVFSGKALLNNSGSNGVLLDTWRTGNPANPTLPYVSCFPVVAFKPPYRTWSNGNFTVPYTSDILWATGEFTLQITYSTP